MIEFLTADIATFDRWPVSIRAEACVCHGRGTTDVQRIRIDPADHPLQVRLSVASVDARATSSVSVEVMDWTHLQGRTLYARCLSLLAAHWFGSPDMTPRVVGAPIWNGLSLTMTREGATAPPLRFEMQSTGHERAALRWSLRADGASPASTVLLSSLDADPLRAMLHHAMRHADVALLPLARADAQVPADVATEADVQPQDQPSMVEAGGLEAEFAAFRRDFEPRRPMAIS